MIAPVLPDDSGFRFPSLASLRAAHGELLRRQRESAADAAFLAEVETFLHRGRATGALLDENDERWEAQSVLDYWVTYLFRADRRTVDATLDDFAPELAPKLPDEACPYVGLDPFRESRFAVFFGRQRMVRGMLDRLASERFLAVVGSSGSGKSSVVLAGVLPALKAGALPGSASWHYLPPLVSGSDPLAHLARTLSPPGTGAATLASAAARLREEPGHALEMVAGEGGRPCVLVVDQFEEIFTLCGEEPVRQAFVDVLATLVQSPGLRHTVLLTLRSDYEDNVAKLGSFQPLFESAQVRVMPLSEAELRDAILKPAELVGLKFENGVVDALLHDILGEQAGLPLLQFALLKLWENRKHDRVTWEAYQSLGGVRLALATSADSFYRSLNLLQDQDTARRILLRMVRPNEGLEITSSRIRRADLHRTGDDPGRIDRVLGRLVGVHLVRLTPGETLDDDLFEVAHEALVRNWPALVGWLKEERSEIATRSRLEAMVKEWLLLEKRGGLLDEAQLSDAERWLASSSASLLGYHPELPALVEASRQSIEEGKRKEEETRQRELEQARQLAEAERNRAQDKARSSRIFLALTVFLAMLLLLSLWASKRAADSQRKTMEAERQERQTQELLTAQSQATQRLRTESERVAAAMRIERVMEARRQSEVALRDIRRQKDLTDEALKKLQKQKDLTEAALADFKKQKELAEDRLTQTIAAKAEADQALADSRAAQERAEAEKQAAREALDQYLEQKKLADKAQALTVEAYQHPEAVRTANRVLRSAGNLQLDQLTRPLRLGASIGSPEGVNGSLCCVVKDKAGQKYLLSLRSVFAGAPGAPILQPGFWDGGIEANKVATLVRFALDNPKGGAIAKLDPGMTVDFHIREIGRIKGIESTVYPGDKVRLVGRSSGIVEGRVIHVNDREVVTTLVARPGETGAPVLAADGELVGLLWGSDRQQSLVVRIKPILRELAVELVEH